MSGISPMSNQAFTNAVSPFGAPEGNSYDSLGALRGEVYPGELAGDTVHLSSQSHEEEPGFFGKVYNATTGFIANAISWAGLAGAGVGATAAGLISKMKTGGLSWKAIVALTGATALTSGFFFSHSSEPTAAGHPGSSAHH